jgi:hypothetical protein
MEDGELSPEHSLDDVKLTIKKAIPKKTLI